MQKKLLYLIGFLFFTFGSNAQTLEELKAKKAGFETEMGALKGNIEAIDAQIKKDFPNWGWEKNMLATVGANISNFTNWVNVPNRNARNTAILGSLNAQANNIQEKYFWRNGLGINLGWQKLVIDHTVDGGGNDTFTQTSDIINLSSLYGRNITSKLAVSALGEYRSTLINRFNNPGYLDLGVGFTYTPMSNFIVVFHPLNYNFIFSDNDAAFTSSLGTKLLAKYNTTIASRVKWQSTLSSFLSYKDINALSNHTWTNTFSIDLYKGLGLGFEHAFRLNKQETKALNSNNQQYWIFGLSYKI